MEGCMLMSTNGLCDDQRGVDVDVGLAQGADDAFASTLGWTEIDKQDLVLVVMNNIAQFGAKADEIDFPELAFEYRKLQVVSPCFHGLEDLAQTLRIGDVVRNYVGVAHEISVFKPSRPQRQSGCGRPC